MKGPELSNHFKNRNPSSIRQAQLKFQEREDKDLIEVINLAIGNVKLPMYPSMINRLKNLGQKDHFQDGVIPYTSTVGTEDSRKAFLNILSALDIDTSKLYVNITDGGSSSMEIMMLGVSGPSSKSPIMLLDPSYTNYIQFAQRLKIPTVTIERRMNDDGSFEKLNFNQISAMIKKHKPSALIVIPYDNPTGQFINQKTLDKIAKICVENSTWLVSDEAYRPLVYGGQEPSSIWKISLEDEPGICTYRISIESASKVWNGCGLRIGSIITDNEEFHKKAISEYTANLCANTIGQNIFGTLAHESHENIQEWYLMQTKYYENLFNSLKNRFNKEFPGLIISKPEASIYCILDFKNICTIEFESEVFIEFCAKKGAIKIDQKIYTILLAPMSGFYKQSKKANTQLRLSLVESPGLLKITPKILYRLFNKFQEL